MARTREKTLSLGLAIGLTVLLGAFSVQALLPRPTLAATDRLPNLRMLPLRDWVIQRTDGRRLLRFTTIMGNEGPGAFEVRGYRTSTAAARMKIDQVIFNSEGGFRRVETGAIGRYAGDGHDHWHVQRIMVYELYRVDNPATVRGGAKTGFCFLDTTAWRLGLPHARQSPYYREEWCGTRQTLTNRVGISVGWGDRYPWDFAYQWIDITNLPAGRYTVRSTVDISNWYREADDYDNCRWARVRIPAAGSKVTVLDTGANCGRNAITPVDSFPGARTFDPPRDIVLDAGRHVGFTFNSLGTQLRSTSTTLADARSVSATRRSQIPGHNGRWFYVIDGPWAGHWIRDTARVGFAS